MDFTYLIAFVVASGPPYHNRSNGTTSEIRSAPVYRAGTRLGKMCVLVLSRASSSISSCKLCRNIPQENCYDGTEQNFVAILHLSDINTNAVDLRTVC